MSLSLCFSKFLVPQLTCPVISIKKRTYVKSSFREGFRSVIPSCPMQGRIYFACLLFSDDSFCGFGLGGGGGGFGFGGRAGLESRISFLDCCISLLCNLVCLSSTFLIQFLIFWNTSIAHATRHTCHSLNQLSMSVYNFLISHRPIIDTNP